jgi:hypothetical protein
MMNERIRELAHQAGLNSNYIEGFNSIYSQQLEKFAELIVREVFAKIEYERFEIYQPVKDSVMKHFGVEE